METLATTIDRTALVARYRANRRRTAEIFAMLPPDAYEARAIPLRHPFVFYDGHIPNFAFVTLVRSALGGAPINLDFEELFRRGIDPSDTIAAAEHVRDAWPSRAVIEQYTSACDAQTLDALANGPIDDPAHPLTRRAEAYWNVLEHEEMHHETLMYLIHRQRSPAARGPLPDGVDVPFARRAPVSIPAGIATLGADRDGIAFGWDNEFGRSEVAVPAFAVDVDNVTNGEYLAFVRDGGPLPPFWVERDGGFTLMVTFGEVPLPPAWPVYATYDQARAFAAWSGGRIMTEAEYQRAAYGTPAGDERPHPWGGAPPDPARHGNFGWRRFDPEAVGSSPRGASAFGVHDLVGNGWEWTSTPFAPLPGFEPMPSYPVYSSDFFDGEHYVMKGGSPVTSAYHVRRSFRNWFRHDYPYVFATFRRAYD